MSAKKTICVEEKILLLPVPLLLFGAFGSSAIAESHTRNIEKPRLSMKRQRC